MLELWFLCIGILGRGAGHRRGENSWEFEGISPRHFLFRFILTSFAVGQTLGRKINDQ